MLPFLKKKNEAVAQDEEDEPQSFDMIKAIAADLMRGLKKDDASLVEGALEALCEYIIEEDLEQDEQSGGEEND